MNCCSKDLSISSPSPTLHVMHEETRSLSGGDLSEAPSSSQGRLPAGPHSQDHTVCLQCYVNLLFWYQFFCGFSGSTMIDYWQMIFFNLFFTSLPPLIFGILDKDISAETLLALPELYRSGQDSEVRGSASPWRCQGMTMGLRVRSPTFSRHSALHLPHDLALAVRMTEEPNQ